MRKNSGEVEIEKFIDKVNSRWSMEPETLTEHNIPLTMVGDSFEKIKDVKLLREKLKDHINLEEAKNITRLYYRGKITDLTNDAVFTGMAPFPKKPNIFEVIINFILVLLGLKWS